MSKYVTKSGKVYDETKGWGGGGYKQLNDPSKGKDSSFLSAVDWTGIASAADKDNEGVALANQGWKMRKHDMNSLKIQEIKQLLEVTKRDGKILDDATVKSIVGGTNFSNKLAYYHALLDDNADKFGFDSTGARIDPNTYDPNTGNYRYLDDGDSGAYNPQANPYDLLINKNSPGAREYEQAMYDSIGRQEAEVDSTLARQEFDAYKMLGQQQLQLERQIADQRMRQLRSGTTSAQLASQELQNMFAAQQGAAQIAGQTMDARMQNTMQFAQQRGQVTPSLFDMMNQNKTTLANVEAQKYAAFKGAESYSPAAQAQGLFDLSQKNPQAYNNYLTEVMYPKK